MEAPSSSKDILSLPANCATGTVRVEPRIHTVSANVKAYTLKWSGLLRLRSVVDRSRPDAEACSLIASLILDAISFINCTLAAGCLILTASNNAAGMRTSSLSRMA